jgi:predicted HTH transcriptional regulator
MRSSVLSWVWQRRRCIPPWHRRSERIERLSVALGEDLRALIARGESANLEFKSSFRWDLKENKLNRALEGVALKTLAGYMNGNGGTLLIGVADDGSITGLERDYTTLKKRDRDGFEQALMTAVATKLGADACHTVQMLFHSLESRDVCRVMVAPAHRPVYVKDGDAPKLYVRTGVSTRELNVQEAINYTSARWPK